MTDDILPLIRDNNKSPFYLPRAFFSDGLQSYLERGIFVPTNQWYREIDCPNGCGSLARVRKKGPGRYIAVCTHGAVTEEIEVAADEVELCEFDPVAFKNEATPEERKLIESEKSDNQIVTTVARIEKKVDAIKKDTTESRKGVACIVDWIVRIKDRFWHIFGIHKNVSVEEARAAMGDSEGYLRCFARSKLKEPHKTQVMDVARWTHQGHPLDFESTQSGIQNHTVYTINHAAREVMEANFEKWNLMPDAWTDAKALADACRAFMGKEDDPFLYKK